MKTERIELETEAGEDHKVLSAKIDKYSDILIGTTRHERRYGKWNTTVIVKATENV
jgi:hypothetical protein